MLSYESRRSRGERQNVGTQGHAVHPLLPGVAKNKSRATSIHRHGHLRSSGAPVALGGIINDKTIGKLKCEIIAGPANNQLADEEKHSKALAEKGILYAPDYVINAGGLINVAMNSKVTRSPRAL